VPIPWLSTRFRVALGGFARLLEVQGCLKDHAPSGASALALYPSPASGRPIRTQLGAPNRRASGPPVHPTLHQTLPRAAPEPPRSTLDPDRGYYGEAPVGLRRYERALGDAVSPIPPIPSLFFRRTRNCPATVTAFSHYRRFRSKPTPAGCRATTICRKTTNPIRSALPRSMAKSLLPKPDSPVPTHPIPLSRLNFAPVSRTTGPHLRKNWPKKAFPCCRPLKSPSKP
jgi:hypothetical protein